MIRALSIYRLRCRFGQPLNDQCSYECNRSTMLHGRLGWLLAVAPVPRKPPQGGIAIGRALKALDVATACPTPGVNAGSCVRLRQFKGDVEFGPRRGPAADES